jgi:hypothetical protein
MQVGNRGFDELPVSHRKLKESELWNFGRKPLQVFWGYHAVKLPKKYMYWNRVLP